jgi:hypothetical protein
MRDDVMSGQREIRVTRGELYALVLQTFVVIAAVAAAAMTLAPALQMQWQTALGMGVGTFVIALLVLPLQRVLIRTYYGREVPVTGSVLWALGATVLVYGGWWLVQRS